MIDMVVWCAMMMGPVPVHAEGVVLSQSVSFYTVRFNKEILAVRKTGCMHNKPIGGSLIPLVKEIK